MEAGRAIFAKFQRKARDAHGIFFAEIGFALHGGGKGRGGGAVRHAQGKRLVQIKGFRLSRLTGERGHEDIENRAEDGGASLLTVDLVIACADEDEVLFRQANGELAAHAIEGKAVLFGFPDLIAISPRVVGVVAREIVGGLASGGGLQEFAA